MSESRAWNDDQEEKEKSDGANVCMHVCVGPYPSVSFALLTIQMCRFLSSYLFFRMALQAKLEAAGRDMLDQMEQTEGAVRLESGTVLHVLESNPDGPRPTKGSTVKVHYHGTLPDGTVFDSTLSGDPVQFPLAQVIPGWREAMLKMNEGETAMVGIPPEQGYGPQGTPDGRIPGGSTLFFKVQLLEILTGAIGGAPTLLGSDGKKLGKDDNAEGSGLIIP